MKKIRIICTGLGLLLAVIPLRAQNVNPAHPESVEAQHVGTPEEARAHVSNMQLQKDAKELAELSDAVRADMDALKQGMLTKDVTARLQRIEKLSKRVREELTR